MSGPAFPRQERRFAAGLSRHPEPVEAVAEVVGRVRDQLADTTTGLTAPISLAVLFVSGRHIDALDQIVETIRRLASPTVLIGATAVGVVGGSEEIESDDGISLWAASGVGAQPVRLEAIPGQPPILVGLPESIEPGSTLVLVADPYTFPVDALVDEVNRSHPEVAVVGGLASAPGSPERNRIVLDGVVHLEGASGFLLAPGVATAIVSQGCRPVGRPWMVTDAQGQLVRTLGGQRALDRLDEMIKDLPPADRNAAARGIHVGVVANELQPDFDQGDFLIRGLLGADRASGVIAVGDLLEVGQIVQFQIRDAESASNELERLLDGVDGRAGLVFTCNGRGTHLFPEAHHDARRVHQHVGDAVAGMFCAGELGPIAGRNAIHGFTATVVLFR